MLVLSREPGESIVIEDVLFTLIRVSEQYLEASLVKMAGGKSTTLTLPQNEGVDICYDVQVVFISAKGTNVRLGFEIPDHVTITRREMLDE